MKWTGNIAFFGTDDLEKTDDFYSQLLGFKLYKDQGKCKIYKVPGGGMIGFCSHMDIVTAEKSPIITLLTEEVDQVYDKLTKAGVELEGRPVKNEKFEIYQFFGKDPNGYTIEVQKFLD